jgi:ABC-2 type transport system ATP-binding protein
VEQITVLLTTHYLEEADRLARRLAIVDKGRVVIEGTPDGLKGELRGDAVHVELRDPADAPAAVVTIVALAGIRDVTVDGRRLSARADDGAGALPGVLAALDRGGTPVATVTVARPSLDDVYLRHVGHHFTLGVSS